MTEETWDTSPGFVPPTTTGSDHISPWRESHPDLTPLFSVDRLDVLPLEGGDEEFHAMVIAVKGKGCTPRILVADIPEYGQP